MIANHQSPVSYENPAMTYDGYNSPQFGYSAPQSYADGQLPPHILAQLTTEMDPKAASRWYNNHTGQLTPPNSSGGPSPVNTPFGGMGGGGPSGGYPVPQQRHYMDDGAAGRQRSASIGSRASPVGNYDLSGGVQMENVPRWRGEGMVGVLGSNPAAYSLLM
jgi:hypothetical protein